MISSKKDISKLRAIIKSNGKCWSYDFCNTFKRYQDNCPLSSIEKCFISSSKRKEVASKLLLYYLLRGQYENKI